MTLASRITLIASTAAVAIATFVLMSGTGAPSAMAQTEGSMIGTPSHIQLTVKDLISSLAWYAKLGFNPVKGPINRPDSIVYLSDGQVVLALVTGNAPSPILVMRAPNLRALRDSLDQLEIPSGFKLRGPTYSELQVASPSGLLLSIRLATDEDSIVYQRGINPTCGPFGEISITTASLPAERTFWEQLGWGQIDGNETPYPFAVMSDGRMKIGIHQGLDLPGAVITYFSHDAADRVARLKSIGLNVEPDIVAEAQESENAALKSPDGQLLLVFKDPKAK